MEPFDFSLRTRVVFGDGSARPAGIAGARARLHAHADRRRQGHRRGRPRRARGRILEAAGIVPAFFHDFDANPDTAMVEAGRALRGASAAIDSIVALGGGSSLDCAKGINFVLTNGGSMRDYRGHGKASRPMLPSIGMPTTAGTGSDAQSYALISDAETHAKMACGDPKAAFRIAILDPALTVSQPESVTAVAGYDALSHAVESFVTRAAHPRVGALRPRGLAAARRELRARAGRADGPRGARRDAARRARSRHRHRAVDARRDARLRESADRALRHDPWRRDRRHASARRPLERTGRPRPLRGAARRVGQAIGG